jgi:hypothetical protein
VLPRVDATPERYERVMSASVEPNRSRRRLAVGKLLKWHAVQRLAEADELV